MVYGMLAVVDIPICSLHWQVHSSKFKFSLQSNNERCPLPKQYHAALCALLVIMRNISRSLSNIVHARSSNS